MSKKFENEKKGKEKEEQKKLKEEAKKKEKEEQKKLKEEAQKIKDETKLTKIKKKTNNLILSITDIEEENVVVSSLNQTQNINKGCVQINKTGTNKGNACGLTILNDCLCKRHYNLKNKKSILNI